MTCCRALIVGALLFAFGCDKKEEAPAAPPGAAQPSAPAVAESVDRERRDRPREHEWDGGHEHEHEQK